VPGWSKITARSAHATLPESTAFAATKKANGYNDCFLTPSLLPQKLTTAVKHKAAKAKAEVRGDCGRPRSGE